MDMAMMGFGFLMMLLILVAAAGTVALVVWEIVHFTGGTSGGDATARKILDERYARGEIDEDENARRKRQLS